MITNIQITNITNNRRLSSIAQMKKSKLSEVGKAVTFKVIVIGDSGSDDLM